jgi:hypothetical protein
MTTTDSRSDQRATATHARIVAAGTDTRSDQALSAPHTPAVAAGNNSRSDQRVNDPHTGSVAASPTSKALAKDDATTRQRMPAPPEPSRVGPAIAHTSPLVPTLNLLDPTLALAADVVDDLERIRIANRNRLRQLTRSEVDSDGEERGFGLPEDHPDVMRLYGIVAAMDDLEHQATLQLQRTMRRHPLGPWVKNARGVGEKQAARLLASIGDPFWNDLHSRPRTVSELWAYCGLHTLPTGQMTPDDHSPIADGGTTGDLVWVAARRTKGKRSNWSADAKMRAWNVAVSCIKSLDSPYRAIYLERREATAERVHATPCVRCGPAGHPAQAFTPWSKGHQHADALRIVSKRVLRDLWRAARDLHQLPASQHVRAPHRGVAGGS